MITSFLLSRGILLIHIRSRMTSQQSIFAKHVKIVLVPKLVWCALHGDNRQSFPNKATISHVCTMHC